ncbi:hypothetical protein MTO96_001829 [Rhipicephalus appendiculatus]
MVQEPTDLYGFGSEHHPVTRSLGHCKAKVSIDGVVAENIPVLVVPDDAQRVDILVGRTFTELPNVTYAKVGSTFRFYHLNDCPFVHLVSPAQKTELHVKAPEEFTLQKNSVNYVTTSSDRSVTTFLGHCGRDVLPEREREEITATVDDPKQLGWDDKLKSDECKKNNAPSKSTSKRSMDMLHLNKPNVFGLELQQPADMKNPLQPPQKLKTQVRQRLLNEQDSAKQACNRPHYRARLHEDGEIGFTSKTPEQTGNMTKTQPKCHGPLVVTQAYSIADLRRTLTASQTYVADLRPKGGCRFATSSYASLLKKGCPASRESHHGNEASEESQEEENVVRQIPQHERTSSTRLRDYVL